MTVDEILRRWLEEHGYDGLVADGAECGCEIADLIPCDSPCDTCQPAYRGVNADGDGWALYASKADAEASKRKEVCP